jgi:glucose/mannose-6-phosphate isomerase
MLDDLKYIAQKDTRDALGVAEKTPQQLLYSFSTQIGDAPQLQNAVLSGMGGSALAASLFLSWPGPHIPFVVNRQYSIPAFVGENTLFIASSYSGNTEETLSALEEASKQQAFIVVIASGGRLQELATERGYPCYLVPSGLQPRMSVFYVYRALCELFEALKAANGLVDELESSVEFLSRAVMNWRPDVPTKDNIAKQYAEEIAGKTPVIYAGPALSAAAYKWKISFNENAKNVAFYNQWPEFNHNEMLGWTSHPIDKPFQPIELRSQFEHERINRRFELSNRLLSGRMPHPLEIHVEGNTPLEHLLWSVLLGDFVTLYTALLNGVDPTPVELIERLKQEL